MGAPRKYSHEEAIERARAGETTSRIAESYGVSYSSVAGVLQRAGVTRPTNGRPAAFSHSDACDLYRDGETVEEIAEYFGVTTGAVRYALGKQDLLSRRQKLEPDEAIKRAAQGESAGQIAESLGVHVATVRRALRDSGISPPTKRMRLPQKEAIRRYLAGESVKRLAEEYGVSVSTIYKAATKHGAKRRQFKSKRPDGRGHYPAGRRRNLQPPPKGWPSVEAFLEQVNDYCASRKQYQALANVLNVHRETVRRWLSGAKWPRRETMAKICRWYRSQRKEPK